MNQKNTNQTTTPEGLNGLRGEKKGDAMFAKKMMTRIAQIAPLAMALTFSLSPALARSTKPTRLVHKKVTVRVVSLTPANGQQPRAPHLSGSGSAYGNSTSSMPRLDVDGGSNGPTRIPGGATPGGGVIGDDPSVDQPSSGAHSEGSGVELDPDTSALVRAIQLYLEILGGMIEMPGGIPQGEISVDEGA